MKRNWEPNMGRLTAALVAAVLAGAAVMGAMQPGMPPGHEVTEPLSLNSASAAELEMLPGVGPSLAQRIVEDRQANGPFASVRQLDRVKGVGPAMLERLEPYVQP